MPYIRNPAKNDTPLHSEVLNGVGFAHGAVEFAALGLIAAVVLKETF